MAASTVSNSPSFWKNLAKDSNSCVKHVNKKMHFLFPPYYFENVKKSVKTIIDQKLNSYQEDLGGILAGHGNIAVTRPNNEVFFNKCESHVDIVGDFYVFNPLVGSQLTGTVNKVNQGQIGCLTHGLFNISLPKPFALPIQSWLGSSVKINDEILFTIIKVDFGSHVPYIQGNIEEVRPRAAMPDIKEESSSKEEGEVEDIPLATSKDSPDVSECLTEETKLNSSSKPETMIKVSSQAVLSNISNSVPPHNAAENSINNEEKKRKRLSEDPIGVTPMNKRSKSESMEPGDDDENHHLVVNLFAQVSETILSTPSSNNQKARNKKLDKNDSQATKNEIRLDESPEENSLIAATATPETHLNSATSSVKASKSSSKKRKRDSEGQRKSDESMQTNGSENPRSVIEEKSSSTPVGAFVVEKINGPTISSAKKSSKVVNMDKSINLTDSPQISTALTSVSKSSKKKKNTDIEENEALNEELINNILNASGVSKSASSKKKKNRKGTEGDESLIKEETSFSNTLETPKSVPKSSKKKKNNCETEDNNLLNKEDTNNLSNAFETPQLVSKSIKKKKAQTITDDDAKNGDVEENELIIKELLGSALCKTPIKTTPKIKSQKRKSLSAVSESISVKKEKDSAPGEVNVAQQIMKIMQQVQEKDKTKRMKKRSL